MVETIQKLVTKKTGAALLEKHGIEVIHYLPGRVRVKVLNWQAREGQLMGLLQEAREDPEIISATFTKETGSALIHYNKDAVKKISTLHRWKTVVEKYI